MQRTSRRAVLRSIGAVGTVGAITMSNNTEFISPTAAANTYHQWTSNSSDYHDADSTRSGSGIGHCTTIGGRGSYEHPDRPGEYRHEFTFSAQSTAEIDGDKRYCITEQEYRVQATSDSIREIFAGTGNGNGITPRDDQNWDWGAVAEEVAIEAASEVGRWVDRAATAYEILNAMVEASPNPTAEDGPGWTDTETYGVFSQPAEIGQNSGFIVDVVNDNWSWMTAESVVTTVPSYPNTTKGFDVLMVKDGATPYDYGSSTSSTSGGSTFDIEAIRENAPSELAYPEKHPEELSQEAIDSYGIEKVAPEDAAERARELNLSPRSRDLWAETDSPIYFYHNPPIVALPKSDHE